MPVCTVAAMHAQQRGDVALQVVWPVEGHCHNRSNHALYIVCPSHACFSFVP